MTEHADLPAGEVHIIYQWSYADASARTGATGFVSADIGKVARQEDDDSFWILIATTPTWTEITGVGASGVYLALAGGTMAGAIIMADNFVTRPILKDYGLEVYAHGSVSGAVSINVENGNVQTLTVTDTTTLSITNMTASGDSCSVTVIITQDGSGGHTVNLPTAVWEGGSAPTLSAGAGEVDWITFVSLDGGSTLAGFVSGLNMS